MIDRHTLRRMQTEFIKVEAAVVAVVLMFLVSLNVEARSGARAGSQAALVQRVGSIIIEVLFSEGTYSS